MQVTVKFKKLNPEAEIPRYMSDEAVGMDVRAQIDQTLYLNPGNFAAISTGLSVEIPKGYEIQVRPRSGLALKYGVTVLNTPGTIDSDYRGEIKIILINLGNKIFATGNGDRIAQLVVAPVMQARIEEVAELSQTDRGSGGFGHTG